MISRPFLLQAAMGAGLILLPAFLLFLAIGTNFLVRILMRFFWKIQDKDDYIKNKTPYYKDRPTFFAAVLLSVILLTLLFGLLLSGWTNIEG